MVEIWKYNPIDFVVFLWWLPTCMSRTWRDYQRDRAVESDVYNDSLTGHRVPDRHYQNYLPWNISYKQKKIIAHWQYHISRKFEIKKTHIASPIQIERTFPHHYNMHNICDVCELNWKWYLQVLLLGTGVEKDLHLYVHNGAFCRYHK